MASSVPSSPSYFFGTLSKSMESPSVNSPTATDTPPAPKSLHLLMSRVTSPLRKRHCIFRSVKGFPFWTSAPQVSIDSVFNSLDEPVAPPMPSRPVLPPTRITTSPAEGLSRMTWLSGAAATTAPISIRFAKNPG